MHIICSTVLCVNTNLCCSVVTQTPQMNSSHDSQYIFTTCPLCSSHILGSPTHAGSIDFNSSKVISLWLFVAFIIRCDWQQKSHRRRQQVTHLATGGSHALQLPQVIVGFRVGKLLCCATTDIRLLMKKFTCRLSTLPFGTNSRK